MNIWNKLRFLAIPFGKEIYYDPNTQRFFQVKRWLFDSAWCGDFCGYYNDAQTSIQRQRLSHDYIRKCTKIKAIDKFPKAEICSVIKAWKVVGY